MSIPDPEQVGESKFEVEITDLDSPSESGTVPGRSTKRHRVSSLRVRAWMSIAMIAGIALLVVIVPVSIVHRPEATKVTALPVPINYPVSLSVVGGVCYASSTNGVVTAIRVSDGVSLWHHANGKASEEFVTVADGIIYLAPLFPIDSTISTATVEALQDGSIDALRASSGSLRWRRAMNS